MSLEMLKEEGIGELLSPREHAAVRACPSIIVLDYEHSLKYSVHEARRVSLSHVTTSFQYTSRKGKLTIICHA